MQRRQDKVEMFSTFIKFDLDRFSGWIADPKLRRSMRNCLEVSPSQNSDSFWAIYWYQAWHTQSSSLAISHLSAYLQEACYWSARKFILNFSSHSSLADYFQIAIAHLGKVLKGFNPQYSSHLKSYAGLSFERIIKDQLRLRRETDICSDWGLLHKISRKRLVKSLQNMGFNTQNVESYVLAWECFQELYSTDNTNIRQHRKPDTKYWEAITSAYNSERLSRLNFSSPAVDSQTIEKWLLSSAQAVRNFLYPQVVSADAPLKDDGNGNLLDMLPVDEQSSLLAQIIEQEKANNFKNQQTQLNQVLNQAIAELDNESQQLLQLYYVKQLTQTKIAAQLEIKQYQVSRRFSRVKKSLLLALTQWSEKILHISPKPDVVAAINNSLEEWLKFHYENNNTREN
ncbi:sigma-70 family RNA polymerase sigma factor [Mastigocoleus testarum]|uniref:Group 3/4 sigma-70 RNA polymerase sigma factor n=1 Tax=Mastigocoleus testarum BC008 TaxID=371196 RepID=A0A0V7ZYQ7_9CYAN|nr:sigma-70 family RNA polymerase sigma factor [Mastigocoleus testarum]KST69398.1 group 3/4 sigma-70 RNA polymerase sigma factor [Mastigocoleus testarum BC008]